MAASLFSHLAHDDGRAITLSQNGYGFINIYIYIYMYIYIYVYIYIYIMFKNLSCVTLMFENVTMF